MRTPKIPFMDIMPELQTGDIFLARGEALISMAIEQVTRCDWSHVGIIVKPSDLGMNMAGDPPHLWESTRQLDNKGDLNKLPDLLTGKVKDGPMLVDLARRIDENLKSRHYRIFAIRYMNMNRTPEFRAALKQFLTDPQVQQAGFPDNAHMIRDFIRHRLLGAPVEKNFFCSQLAATTYHAVGLMPDQPDPKSYVPKDFSRQGYAPFLKRATLGPEVYIGPPSKDPRYKTWLQTRGQTPELTRERKGRLEEVSS